MRRKAELAQEAVVARQGEKAFDARLRQQFAHCHAWRWRSCCRTSVTFNSLVAETLAQMPAFVIAPERFPFNLQRRISLAAVHQCSKTRRFLYRLPEPAAGSDRVAPSRGRRPGKNSVLPSTALPVRCLQASTRIASVVRVLHADRSNRGGAQRKSTLNQSSNEDGAKT